MTENGTQWIVCSNYDKKIYNVDGGSFRRVKGLSCANPVGGNRTGQARRAYIVNFRPASMIDVERKNDYDHGKAGLQKANMKGQVHGDSQK